MKQSRTQLLIGIGIIVLSTAGFFFYKNGKIEDAKGDAPKYKEMAVERGMFQIVVSASGLVQPIDRVEIKSKASGRIDQLPVEEGDFVKKGALIARLDQTDVRAEVDQAQADLEIAQAELKQAQHTFDRRDQLFQKGLISAEERDQIELTLAQAKGRLIRARTALDQAQVRLNDTIVRAPISGIILQKYVEEGQIISSGISNVGGGSPIADIADMKAVYIEAGIDEIDVGKVRIGQPAKVVADAFPQTTFSGQIIRIAPEAKVEQNVTLFDVVIAVANKNGKLKSGMNATVDITIVRKEDVLLVPTMALKKPQSRKAPRNVRRVLLKQDGEFKPHKVEIGLSDFKHAIVLSGLQENDIVGIPMFSRLKAANERLERMIKSSRSFGTSGSQSSSRRK
ncbi:MAG: efflux RND transporter periplasmic adaptor subunit [bacterium]